MRNDIQGRPHVHLVVTLAVQRGELLQLQPTVLVVVEDVVDQRFARGVERGVHDSACHGASVGDVTRAIVSATARQLDFVHERLQLAEVAPERWNDPAVAVRLGGRREKEVRG
jgi:hypothetical protein